VGSLCLDGRLVAQLGVRVPVRSAPDPETSVHWSDAIRRPLPSRSRHRRRNRQRPTRTNM